MDRGSYKTRKRNSDEPFTPSSQPKRTSSENRNVEGESSIDDGGGEKIDAEYSGMKEPPLIKQLKRILSEYPDNGQIIKELIQNAEDAEASAVQVIYDKRRINENYSDEHWFTKFFRGPALCVTNDAKFTEKDWIGIKMIASSVKEENKLKVGRFGMGFKSVFHMTDYPCILSGDRLLCIDPTGASNKINAEMKLKDLRRYKGLNVDAFFEAFGETIGISNEVIKTGHYEGTAFWFPLRCQPSIVSATIYNDKKTMDLFMSFAHDASVTLLFLCHLVKVSLKIRNEDSRQMEDIITAALVGDIQRVIQERGSFIKAIEEKPNMDHEPLLCTYDMTVNICCQNDKRHDKWRIMHYYIGTNASEQLRALGSNPDLGFCQCVGIALPINCSAQEHFESRVFCFMPLPKDSHKQTGLPVHVNGFFALSQNRHHLKWPTEDQKDQDVTDIDILWNSLMIDECLVETYKEMIKTTKSNLIQQGTLEREDINIMYKLVPYPNEVVEKWRRLIVHLKSFLQSFEFLYSMHQTKFLTLNTASFAILNDLPKDILHIKGDIIQALEIFNVPYVGIDERTFEKLTCYSDCELNDLTPRKLADILRNNIESLKQMSLRRKHAILCYLLSGEDYSVLENLPLILTPGGWKIFQKSGESIYLCNLEQVPYLFPSAQNKVVVRTEDMGDYVWTHMTDMAKRNVWQIRMLYPRKIGEFIKLSLDEASDGSGVYLRQGKLKWFEEVWMFIDENMKKENLKKEDVKDLRLVPEIVDDTQANPGYVKIHELSSHFLEQTDTKRTEIFDAFRALGVIIIPQLPDWFPKQKCIFSSDDSSLRILLGTLADNTDKSIKNFNSLTKKTKDAFLRFLCNCDGFDGKTISFLKKLKIFCRVSRETDVNSDIALNDTAIYFREKIPVDIQEAIIEARTEDIWQLLVKLDAKEVSKGTVFGIVLDEIRNDIFRDDIEMFMKYFCDNINIVEANHELIKSAKEVPFLKLPSGERKRPREAFDPTEKDLTALFQYENNKFPVLNEYQSGMRLYALRLLGLKGVSSLTAKDIASTAFELQKLEDSINDKSKIRQKSLALMNILEKNPSFLQEQYGNVKLIEYLKAVKWVITIDKPEHLPPSLCVINDTLCKPSVAKVGSFRHACLVAAVVPLVADNFKGLGKEFGWYENPLTEDVVEQLLCIRKCFKIEEKAFTIPLLNEIYKYFSYLPTMPSTLISEKWIWVGDGFEVPENVVVSVNKNDIETLAPYYFKIPNEFTKYKSIFQQAGCHASQTVHVLIQTVHKMEVKYQHVQQEEEFEKDFQLLLTVIEKLAEKRKDLEGMEVPLPIKSDQPNKILFLPAAKCTVDKNSCNYTLPDDDDSIAFVSDRLSIDVAKALGAKPLNKQILSGTETMGIVGFGQKEKLTDRLRKLVEESYKDGVSVPKELIQNADDAGATVVKFLYDEREHDRITLFSSEMEQCQGPSLLVYNNASFSKSDMENITKLNGATKENDTSKIGRFGLGFCAVYNLTDVPSFVTRNSFVTFDPNKNYLAKFVDNDSPGIRIDFNRHENHKLMNIYEDQFKPFDGVFGFEKSSLKGNGFPGTLFRFPFRTRIQAQKSEIRKHEYSTSDVQQLLEMFVQEASNLVLFTQNVHQLELHFISRNAISVKEQVLVFKAMKTGLEIIPSPISNMDRKTVLRRASDAAKAGKVFKEIHKFTLGVYFSEFVKTVLPSFVYVKNEIHFPWLIVWESGKGESLNISSDFDERSALPLASAAVLCEPGYTSALSLNESLHYMYDSGRFFCFLPLPIKTGLGVHINCSFDVTSDRQRLKSSTDDDKQSFKGEWNRSLLADAAVNGLFSLLEHLVTNEIEVKYYYQLWPLKFNPIAEPLHASFFTRLIGENRPLFYGQGKFISFSSLLFLDPSIRSHSEIGEPGYKMLLNIPKYKNKVIVDIPLELVNALKKYHNISASCIGDNDLFEVLLKHINHNYWLDHTQDRNKLLIYALQSENENAHSLMKECACIPVQPNGNLKKPSQTVDQKGEVSCLFDVEDEMFPLLDFQTDRVRKSLKRLGMMSNKLTENVLHERCLSVENIARFHCPECAFERCRDVLQYLMKNFTGNGYDEEYNNEVSSTFKFGDTCILPVLQKPHEWMFTWHALSDTRLIQSHSLCIGHSDKKTIPVLFGKASCLFGSHALPLIGTVACLIDERKFGDIRFPSWFWKVLGVNMSIPIDYVVRQLVLVSEESKGRISSELLEILRQIYKFLQEAIEKDNTICNTLADKLREKAIIMLDGKLYTAEAVAFNVHRECRPFLNKIPQNDIRLYKDFFRAVGVKNDFSVYDIISVLKQQRIRWEDSTCTEIDTIIGLLENLIRCEELDLSSSALNDNIVGPDMNGKLYPMKELAIADDTFETDMELKILHKSVPPSLAKKLGARLKKQKCFENTFSFICKPFGQKEKLVSRLGNLLRAYPFDSSIMKELLQNADDAKATEIVFIKDFRNLPTEKIFAEECKHFQGPSLCVFNDQYFTDEDLKGIQDLGEGSKREDATKTGQYGVGFNAVYHLTDTPSFLTRGPELPDDGLLCIFDPTCRHIPGVRMDNPGIQCDVKSLKRNFPDALLGFHKGQQLFKNNIGTLFRFPLRTDPSAISENTLTPYCMDDMLRTMSEAMFDSLLFVKNVKHIRISDISSGSFEDDYSVTADISENNSIERETFFSDVKRKSMKLKNEDIQISDIEKSETSYNITIVDTKGRHETYFVVIIFGFENESEIPIEVIKAITNKELGCLPLGGVAVRTSDQPLTDSKAFCFLPLPGTTGLPVHINGHFALNHESRRELWRGDSGKQSDYSQKWNEFIIRKIIVPAYIQCLCHQRNLFLEDVNSATRDKGGQVLETKLISFYSIFPIYKECKNEYWRSLAEELYIRISEEKLPLFPMVNYNLLSCEWVPLGRDQETAYGYFNYQCENNEKLVLILKHIGMKVIHTPLQLKDTMVDSGIKGLLWTSPCEVLRFLATSGNPGTNSKISLNATQISESPIKSIQNWIILFLHICKSSRFIESLMRLPLCPTNDGYLRPFVQSPALYKSDYSWMCPDFQNRFIHSVITKDFRARNIIGLMKKAGFLHELSLGAFEEFVPIQYRNLLEATGAPLIARTGAGCPNDEWVVAFWKFLHEITKREQKIQQTITFRQNAFRFERWCLIPAVVQEELNLIQVGKAYILIDLDSYEIDCHLHAALKKLPLPILDHNIFKLSNPSMDHVLISVLSELKDLTTSYHQPERLLDLLYFWAKFKGTSIIHNNLDERDAVSILKYLSDRLHGTYLWQEYSCKEKLRTLPLFVTITGTLCALNGDFTVHALPSHLPINGLNNLLRQSQIVLLKPCKRLETLYNALSLTETKLDMLYADIILPNIDLIPTELWMPHVTFLKDFYYRVCGHKLNSYFIKVINTLKDIPFIPTKQGFKKCSEFYQHTNLVFLKMCHPDQFLPDTFREENWQDFISVLGIQTDVTEDMLIRFAEEIESSLIINKVVKEKSEVLTKCFIDKIKHLDERTLQRIKKIRFIQPVYLPFKYQMIFPQRKDDKYLICVDGSAMKKNMFLCWSTLNVLPFDIPDDKQAILGIKDVSGNIEVLKHIQNISTELSNKIQNTNEEDVVSLMKILYGFLRNEIKVNTNARNNSKDMLFEFPIIHLPKNKKMAKVIDTVIHLPKADELKPYLFNAPFDYGEFFDTFEQLGVSSELQCCHCLNILFKIYVNANKQALFIGDLRHVKGALSRLNALLESDATGSWGSKKLYLPNAEEIMSESTDLVFCDNTRLRERANISTLKYFLGFSNLELGEIDTEIFAKKLPENLRPKLLTDLVKERFDTSMMEEVKPSLLASRLTSFIRSSDFIVGVCRIAKKFLGQHFERNKNVNRVKEVVLRIYIKEVKKLDTVLEYCGRTVQNTRESRPCFHEKDDNKLTFYFTSFPNSIEETVSNILCSANGLVRLLLHCIDLPFEAETTLMAIFRKYNDPFKVRQFLDEEHFPSLEADSSLTNSSAFPKPGTYVDERLHAFLEQALDLFNESEYLNVALQLEDGFSEDDDLKRNPVYIYVHIISEVDHPMGLRSPLLTKYFVDIGENDHLTVPAYRLFRFVRRQSFTDEITVYTRNIPEEYLPLDENCRRIETLLREAWTLDEDSRRKIIRRLLLQWHPDKNIGNGDSARQVFDFIKRLVERLGREQLLHPPAHTRHRSPNYFFNIFTSAEQRARTYARAYRDNLSEYNRRHDTGHFSHTCARLAVVKDENEARRWLKQGKHDFRAAKEFFDVAEDSSGYNWICFISHQASEKALKAYQYATNANLVTRLSHDISMIARGMPSPIPELASELAIHVGHYSRMRYPDMVNRPKIPAEIFTKEHAEKALELAKDILDNVNDLIS